MNRLDAWRGTVVADAAAMGLHWLYDQEQIGHVETTGPILFRHPDAAHYQDRKGYFAHPGKHSGQLSHYGESARLVGVLAADARYTPKAHQQRFLQVFGPCGDFVGYADRPTKALVAQILTEADELGAISGMDDDQLPALAVVAALFSFGASLADVLGATRVLSTHEDAIAGSQSLFNCLTALADGANLDDALNHSAETTTGELGSRLQEALAMPNDDPLQVAQHFGLACHVSQGLPLVWHLLRHATSFDSAVQANVRCGGDSCGRAMALGAIAGLVHGVPESMTERLPAAVRYDLSRKRKW